MIVHGEEGARGAKSGMLLSVLGDLGYDIQGVQWSVRFRDQDASAFMIWLNTPLCQETSIEVLKLCLGFRFQSIYRTHLVRELL